MDDVRPIVHVTDEDLIAAMQILACIARPLEPARAGELMQQWFWARRRSRRVNFLPELAIPVPDKDRINSKLPALAKDIKAAIRAGDWLKMKWAAESTSFGLSLRQQGARQWNAAHKADIERGKLGPTASRENEAASAKQRIWNKRRPVVHMALAVREELRELHPEGLPDLEAVVFNPVWVPGALIRAEGYAEVAIKHKILKPGEPWRFIR